MVDVIHKIGILARPSAVYSALSTVEGVAGWWTKDTSGESKVGGTLEVRFRTPSGDEIGSMACEVIALEANREVRWRVTAGPKEWLGTEIAFSLSQAGERTLILFAHRNWREPGEFMAHCSMKWATFLLSLRQLIETGQGKPSPGDLKIDDWN